MTQYLTFKVLPNGHLQVSLTQDGKDELARLRRSHEGVLYDELWARLFEYEEEYTLVPAEEIAALTSAPIIGKDWTYDDEQRHWDNDSKVWWFPEYETQDEFDIMQATGSVIFTPSE